MDFEFTPQERAFADEVEKFLERPRDPDVMDVTRENMAQIVDTPERRAFMKKLAAQGWLGMTWPKEYGGQESEGVYEYLLNEALARRGAPQIGKGVGIIGKTLIRHGSEKLKREFLPKILARRGRVRGRLQRAASRLRRREHAAQAPRRSTAAGSSTVRRSGPPRRTSPTGTGWARAPTRTRPSTTASASS